MDNRAELDRIERNNGLDSMPANPWEFDVDLGVVPDRSMRNLLAIMYAVAERSPDSWPSDDEWRAVLPDWLKSEIRELSKEETDKLLSETPKERWDTLPWEFLSWLDAIRDRGWRWWGYKQEESTATIVLHIAMFPERIDAFRELLRASGIRVVEERYAAL
ncbi:hypothetical protein [Burkholderia ubonensis]|uniref:hypothetical protein n=1 Tax=Burkholderia ubonensis TaxID=101571 RepID=UPI0011602BE4|nr:hypothetical protein [Burkholderia ubonensis]